MLNEIFISFNFDWWIDCLFLISWAWTRMPNKTEEACVVLVDDNTSKHFYFGSCGYRRNFMRGHYISFVLAKKKVNKRFFLSVEKYGEKLEIEVDDRGVCRISG